MLGEYIGTREKQVPIDWLRICDWNVTWPFTLQFNIFQKGARFVVDLGRQDLDHRVAKWGWQ